MSPKAAPGGATGLIDMHVHMGESDVAAYVDAGITSVRHMWGVPGMPALAARVVERNELGADNLRGQSGRRRTWLTLAVHGIDRGSGGRGRADRAAGRRRVEVDQGNKARSVDRRAFQMNSAKSSL